MDAQRALLDELMGRNRDGDKPEEDITDFRHRRVCKSFLCGLCPHDLFQNTKMDLGECPNLHLPKMRAQFEKERQAQPNKDFGYDQELERDLIKYVSEVDKKIQRAQRRLEEQDGAKAPSLMDFESCKEVLEITAEIQEVMQKAEEAGNEGEVDLSMELMNKVEELKQKKATAQANAMLSSFRSENSGVGGSGGVGGDAGTPTATSSTDGDSENNAAKDNDSGGKSLAEVLSGNPLASANVNQKLRVCDVCGAFLSIFDSDRRLADHFGGKLHLGYLQIRKKIQEVAEARRERRRQRNGVADELDSKPNDDKKERDTKDEPVERRRDRHSRSKSRSQPRSLIKCSCVAAVGMKDRAAQAEDEPVIAAETAVAIVVTVIAEAAVVAAVAREAAVRVEAEAAAQVVAEEDAAEAPPHGGYYKKVPRHSCLHSALYSACFYIEEFTSGFFDRRCVRSRRDEDSELHCFALRSFA